MLLTTSIYNQAQTHRIPSQINSPLLQAINTGEIPDSLVHFQKDKIVGGDLIISEIALPSDNNNACFVELYNAGNAAITFSNLFIAIGSNDNTITLSGTINAESTYTIAANSSSFSAAYGFSPDLTSSNLGTWLNGSNTVYIRGRWKFIFWWIYYNEDRFAGSYNNQHAVRKADISYLSTTYASHEWHIKSASASARDITPGQHKTSYTWNGSNSNQWDDYNNWTTEGSLHFLPDISSQVIISSSGSYNADSAQSTSPYYYNSLSIESGGSMSIGAENAVYVESSVNIDNNGSLSLKSNGNGSAVFIPKGSLSGSVNVECYFPTIGGPQAGGNWHYFSPPSSDLLSSTFLDQYLMYWDEPNNIWQYITPTDELLTPAKGYGVLLDNDYGHLISINDGSLNIGDMACPTMQYTSGNSFAGFNMIGNPYTASIDWEIADNNLPTGMNNAIYYWDAQTDSYKSYVNGSGTGSRYIPPMQGFFVLVSQDNVNFTIDADARTHTGSDNYYKSSNPNNGIRDRENLLIISTNNNYGKTDAAFLEFHKYASCDFDGYFDAKKFHSNNDSLPEIYFDYKNKEYAVNVIDLDSLCGRIDLCVRYEINDLYSLTFDSIQTYQADQDIFLFDKIDHQYYNLREHQQLSFLHESAYAPDRFQIVFDEYVGINPIEESENWLIYSTNGKLNIRTKNKQSYHCSYSLKAINGQSIKQGHFIGALENEPTNVASGIYIISVQYDHKFIHKKLQIF
ncbi:MAG: hypothetical protein B7C24_01265 [Bacteroidetes bacterium 4572_77]|nr:MAG: hypothetical protein B7C24_01265 [Bacteroidetes bacterium 4572_77]